MKKILRKLLPDFVFKIYHLKLAILANVLYGFPSRKLKVIGITGTKGKSTTSNMVWRILTDAGHKVGMTTTANIRIGDKEWINDTKMTMQGRFKLQKLIKEMVKEGCDYAIIETSSEGILQYRHFGIKYQVAVFTNLMPEHIERHGSFENYKKAKGVLFKKISGQKIIIANSDDKNSDYFLSFPAKRYIKFGKNEDANIRASEIHSEERPMQFKVNGKEIKLPLFGMFNIYNALASISVAVSQNVDWETIQKSLRNFNNMPGRMEEIKSEKGFSVFVDYAHTPESLEMVYKSIKPKNGKLISVLGSCGGGRDKGKRPRFGEMASKYTDIIIITNEDPYDEDPKKIVDEVYSGISKDFKGEKYKIIDRREAIKKAVELAGKGDIITVTGKGSEQHIVTAEGKVKWDDREVVREELKK